jgi:hypothetical protein
MKPSDDAVEIAQFESDLQHLTIDGIDVAQPRLFQLGMTCVTSDGYADRPRFITDPGVISAPTGR